MADIFERKNVVGLLSGKKLVFFGDSNVRHVYKDLIWLLNTNSLIPSNTLKKKGEDSHVGDKLVTPCYLGAGRDYKENRKYGLQGFDIEYFFMTRCFSEQVMSYMKSIKMKVRPVPDVIVINSTFWDLTRWGPSGVEQFKEDLVDLMKLFNETLPEDTMVIWTTALPPGKNIRKGSLLIKQVEFLEHTVRFDVMEANLYAKNIVVKYGYDVLDFHYHLRMQIHRRCRDGLHYQSLAVRLLTNILLTHIALSWGHPLPKNVNNSLLERYKGMVCETEMTTKNSEVPVVIERHDSSVIKNNVASCKQSKKNELKNEKLEEKPSHEQGVTNKGGKTNSFKNFYRRKKRKRNKNFLNSMTTANNEVVIERNDSSVIKNNIASCKQNKKNKRKNKKIKGKPGHKQGVANKGGKINSFKKFNRQKNKKRNNNSMNSRQSWPMTDGLMNLTVQFDSAPYDCRRNMPFFGHDNNQMVPTNRVVYAQGNYDCVNRIPSIFEANLNQNNNLAFGGTGFFPDNRRLNGPPFGYDNCTNDYYSFGQEPNRYML